MSSDLNDQYSEGLDLKKETSTEHLSGVLQFKIVYWGPGESGKTTNYYHLREYFHGIALNRGCSIQTTDGRTLWQDSIRISFFIAIKAHKYNVIAQLVTCTGQERFLTTREYVLDGADGVVFVADSDSDKMDENQRSFRELLEFISTSRIPYVVQLNKRDVSKAIPVKVFKHQLGLPQYESYGDESQVIYESIATRGIMVRESFQDLMIQVIARYFARMT
jgi:signal recognition particle receptor subunit beta